MVERLVKLAELLERASAPSQEKFVKCAHVIRAGNGLKVLHKLLRPEVKDV